MTVSRRHLSHVAVHYTLWKIICQLLFYFNYTPASNTLIQYMLLHQTLYLPFLDSFD